MEAENVEPDFWNEPLVGIKEAAAFLDVHPNTVRNLIYRGHLPASQIGPHRQSPYRIRPADLRALIKRGARYIEEAGEERAKHELAIVQTADNGTTRRGLGGAFVSEDEYERERGRAIADAKAGKGKTWTFDELIDIGADLKTRTGRTPTMEEIQAEAAARAGLPSPDVPKTPEEKLAAHVATLGPEDVARVAREHDEAEVNAPREESGRMPAAWREKHGLG